MLATHRYAETRSMLTLNAASISALVARTVLALALTLPAAAWAQHRVVFQVSDADPAKWNLALNNARNVQQELATAEVEIVAYGPGIGMLKMDSTVATRIAEALTQRVKVVACENTMTAQKLTRADMTEGIAYVPAGVVELIRLQREGWAYIRP